MVKFQSTHLHEVWHISFSRCGSSRVSIHTPTWGVTIPLTLFINVIGFQSTHLHEVWLSKFKWKTILLMFQSTHLHEVWLFRFTNICLNFSFNPHTYMRCDKQMQDLSGWDNGFNPHTYMRCDAMRSYKVTLGVKFQSTHLHEVWLVPFIINGFPLCFNPHTYMRCDFWLHF